MYSLFLKRDKYVEDKSKYDYVYLSSITKFVVMLGFLNCIRAHHLRVTSKAKKVFPEFQYDYTFQDNINHRTALANDWIGSSIKKYSKSRDTMDRAVKTCIITRLLNLSNLSCDAAMEVFAE